MNNATLTYRRDIDGLRAVAVSLVILYHAGVSVPGGFIGVDVFFVISGFLITGIIQKQQAKGRFRLRDFWIRRIRRIVPAATCMVIATVLVGYWLLLPIDYESLAASAISQAFMAANIYFWRHSGYFAGPSEMMPLLHTWSLAVEEQFYLIYPLILVWLSRYDRRWQGCALAIGAVGSFVLGVWALPLYPSATFFLLPTRAWEMLLGGLLCTVGPPSSPRKLVPANVCSIAGLLLIILPAMTYTATSSFPGLRAAPPCIGAALIIFAGCDGRSVVNRILSWRPLVFIGALSYSLYLWHWPVIVFLRHAAGPRLGMPAMLGALATTVGISYLSWRFVETPFRSEAGRWQGKTKAAVAIASAVGSVLLSGIVLVCDGFPHRAPERSLRVHAAKNDAGTRDSVSADSLRRDQVPVFGDTQGRFTCLVWGDSHAQSLVAGLDEACRQAGFRGLQATYFGTAPVTGFSIKTGLGLQERAVEHADEVVAFARRQNVDVIVLAAFWTRYEHNPALEGRLRATVDQLRTSGIDVAIVLDVAAQEQDVPLMLARRAFRGEPTDECGVSSQDYDRCNGIVNSVIRRVAEGTATVLDPAPFLTDDAGVWRAEMDGVVLYCDDDHLTTQGSRKLAPMFREFLDQVRRTKIQTERIE